MSVRFHIVDAEGLLPYVDELKDLEQAISYPISDGADAFVIDHGPRYHPFFSDMGSKALFLVVLDENRVVGSLAGVWKESVVQGQPYTGLYFADLKLHPQYRGRNLSMKIFWHGLFRWPLVKAYQGWDFAFFAAMQGQKGDVKRSFRRFHLGRWTKPVATMRVFFVSASTLLSLSQGPLPPQWKRGTHLSSPQSPLVQWNDGKKDFRLRSTGAAWKLAHVNVFWGERGGELGENLQEAGRIIRDRDAETLACFAIDERLKEPIAWLTENNIVSDTVCTIYALSFFAPSLQKSDFLVLSTGDI